MFGQPRSTPFGAPAATPFGSPAPAFGAPSSTPSAFGSSASTFGAPSTTSAFGSSAPSTTTTGFGATPSGPSSGFGTTGGFGSPAPAPAFGAPSSAPFGSAAPTGGGLFGSSATPSTTGGGGGLFGASAATPAFGSSSMTAGTGGGIFGAPSSTPATTGFGGFGSSSTTAFGASAPAAASTSLFGSPPAAQSGGLFGSSAPAPSGGLFGSAAPAPSGGLFGSAAPAPSGGLFGSAAPASSGGLFGSTSAAASSTGMGGSGGGTTVAPFQETRKLDGTANISFQSITAMPAYESKSFEELRMEDYLAGNKGSQGQSQPSTMGAGGGGFGMSSFGAPAPSSGGFGFGGATSAAPSTGGFGFGASSPSAPAFGSPSTATSAFGAAPAPAGGGLFGSAAPAPSTGGLFGSAAQAPAPSGGLFGSMAPAPSGGLFGGAGTSAPAPSGGLFGSTPAPAPSGGLFGSAPAPAPSGGFFGSGPTPAPSGGLFGSAPTPSVGGGGGLFGSAGATPAPAPSGGLFGSTASTPAQSGGLFGSTAPAPSGGLFGSTAPAPATSGGLFGSSTPAPAPSGGLFGSSFGAPKPATGGLFSSAPAPSLSGGLFGSTTPTPAPSGGLFGSTTPSAAPTFGAQTSPPAATPGATTILVPPSSETLLAQQMAAIENQNKELALLEAWRGGSRQSPKQSQGSVIPTSIYQRDAKSVRYRGLAGGLSPPGTLNGTSPSVLSSYHAGPRSSAMIRPRGFKPTNVSLGSASRTTKSILSPSPLLGSATKQLVIKSDALTPKPKTRLILSDDEISAKKTPDESETPRDLIKGRHIQNGDTPSNQSDRILPFEDSRIANEKSDFQSPEANGQHVSSTPESKIQMNSSKKTQSGGTPMDEAYDFYRSVIGTSPTAQNGEPIAKQRNISLVPKLMREGYVMTPSAESLSKMSEADLAAVPNFVVERIGFGSVAWEGAVDVRGIDLDSVVSIESKAVEVYHKEEENGVKPPVGTKLNRPAILTLHNVYPKSGAGAPDTEKEQFERKIAKKTKEMGASLILYDPDIGVWKLHVEHFSRYALDDDSDDDDDTHSKDILATQSSPRADFDSGVRGGRTQVSWENSSGITRFHISDNEDEYMHVIDENPLLSKDTEANGAEAAAEAAYAELCHLDQQIQHHGSFEEEHDRYYHEENEGSSYIVETHVFEPPSRPLSSVNICAQIAEKCGIKRPTSSAIDFGLRMGKSFGVCWRPDGSFLHPVSTLEEDPFQLKKLVQSRPVVSNPLPPDHLKLLKVHLKHASNINEGSNFPLFRFADDRMAIDACADVANEIGWTDVCNCEDTIDTSHVFSLVAILFSDTNKLKSFSSIRQKEAEFRVWLRNLCSVDPDSNVTQENGCGDGYEAIFKALSGDDFRKASSLAQRAGHNMLALLIANSNSLSISFLSEQMRLWNSTGAINLFPPELVRIYSYLTRDLQIENTLYQNGSIVPWERRLMMLLRTIYGQSRSGSDSLLTRLINQYERDVKNGLAPPANTKWCKRTSTLFRIMKLFVEKEVGGKNISLLKTISPFGHRINPFDVSISFHLSAILSSLEICEELSEDEEIALLESYAFQLQIIGAWEWAVYVCLCRLKISRLSQSTIDAKKSMAIEVIRKHYWSDNDSLMQEKRSFLEQEVGIPSQWFEDSLKFVAIMKFDIKSFLTHGLLASKQEALQVYEEAVLPDIVFSGDEDDMNDLYCVLNEVHDDSSSDETSFREVVFDFLKFRSQASRFLTETNMAEVSSHHVLGAAQSVQHRLICLEKNYPSSMMLFPGLPLAPRCIVLKEMMNSVSVMVGMIENVVLGKHLELSHGVATTLDYSRSAFSRRNDDLMFHHLDPRSCLRGMFKLKDPDAKISIGPNYRPSSFL